MFTEYFVLVSDEYFGVFDVSASDYPRQFKDNIKDTKCMELHQVEEYLLQEVGRNCLTKNRFHTICDVGKIMKR